MKQTFLFVALVIGMIATTFGQTVILKDITKTWAGGGGSTPGLVIAELDGTSRFIPYENASFRKSREENTLIFQLVLNKYLNKGYKIISSSAGGTGGNITEIVTTYILAKE
jgi:hypothetical protein